MKKSLIFVGLLAVGYANAQELNVGINTDQPKATLDIQPNATNLAGTTNEGIIIPKLTKARVATIATDKLVEGTKVYVTDEVTAADTKFIGTGKGFYFYNGTKWVKQLASDTDTNSELWAQRDNAGVTETYLKPSNDKTDFIGYRSDRKWAINLGGITENDAAWEDGEKDFEFSTIPNLTLTSSDVLPSTLNSRFGKFRYNFNLIKPNHSANNVGKGYFGFQDRTLVKNATTKIQDIFGGIVTSEFHSSQGSAGSLHAFSALVGVEGKVDYTEGLHSGIRLNSKGNVDLIHGATLSLENKGGSFKHGKALRIMAPSALEGYNNKGLVSLRGIDSHTLLRNGDKADYLAGIENFLELKDNSNSPLTYGTKSTLEMGDNIEIGDFNGMELLTQKGKGSLINRFYGVKLLTSGLDNTFRANEMYGIYLDNVNKGTNNYSIYTNEGKVRFGDKLGVGKTPESQIDVLSPTSNVGQFSSSQPDAYIRLMANNSTDNRFVIWNFGEKKLTRLFGFADNNPSSGINIKHENGFVGFATDNPEERLDVNGNIKSSSLAGVGNRNVYADENGVLKVGSAIESNNGVQTQSGMTCTAENAGKINYTTIQKDGKDVGVFGFCMQKGTDYVWAYMLGGSNIYGTSDNGAAFGQGL